MSALTMPIMFVDPGEAREARERFVLNGGNCDPRFTEVWEGVEVVPPMPNEEHQEFVVGLIVPIHMAIKTAGLGRVYPGVNVSDRAGGWTHNYRGPDVVVYLNGNPAVNHGTHFEGGPDFLAEILSPGEGAYDKFDFYAKVNTREVMLVFRDPWAVELHQLQNGRFALLGRSDEANPVAVPSAVLPLAFRLVPGTPRPTIEVAHTGTGQTWKA
jgi:Uma2 family endonuclease